MAQIPTTTKILYKPRVSGTTMAWAAIYKDVKQVTATFYTDDKIDCYTTKPEADLKASTNTDKPPKGGK